MLEHGVAGDRLERACLVVAQPVVPVETDRALTEDGGVQHARGEVRARDRRVYTIALPQARGRFAIDLVVPGDADRRDGRVQLLGDRDVTVVDRVLHGLVAGDAVVGPAGAPRRGEIEDGRGRADAHLACQLGRRRKQLRALEVRSRRLLALILQHDDVPLVRPDCLVGVR